MASAPVRIAAALFGVAVGIGVAEGGARLLEPFLLAEGLREQAGERVADPVLEYRTAPRSGDHDARGFRNARALDRADVVALGDSQTWGVNAERSESWPAQLERATGLRVYNMGRGGYGMLQYHALLDEALALQPSVIVVAFYFGNDLYDAYDLAYKLDAHERWRHPDLAERERIAGAAYPNVRRLFFERLRYRPPGFHPREWLRDHSALARLVGRAAGEPRDTRADIAWARDHPTEGFAQADRDVATVFHTTYRLAAVDRTLPRIREGLRISQAALQEMQQRVYDASGTELLVLLLPTKERVFEESVARRATPAPESYARSVAEETGLARELVAWMDARDIHHVDALPALRDALRDGEAIFPPNVDGHFTVAGYRVIARVVADELASGRSGIPRPVGRARPGLAKP